MITSDRFLRFAAECEVMAKFTHSAESRVTWKRIAQRWVRCAELMDQRDPQRPRVMRKAVQAARQAS